MKTCNKCGETKPLDGFKKDKRQPAGYGGMCKPCANDQQRKTYAADPAAKREKTRAYQRQNVDYYSAKSMEWAANNPDRMAEIRSKYLLTDRAQDTKKAWMAENIDAHKANVARWSADNSAVRRAHAAKRRAGQLQRTPAWSDPDAIAAIYAQSGPGLHVDHIIPLQGELVSGLHVAANLQILTATENLSKSNTFEVAP